MSPRSCARLARRSWPGQSLNLKGGRTSADQPVAKEALGIDRVKAQPLAQLLAQLADVAFDDVLLDLVVEDAVDRVEDLGSW